LLLWHSLSSQSEITPVSAKALHSLYRGLASIMASVTAPPPIDPAGADQTALIPLPSAAPNVVRIDPPHGWLELRLHELWEYRELLYFFVWRDIKVRYKQTVVGVLWVVLQPLMTMGVFTIFFGRLAKLPSEGLPYPVFYFAALVPWAYFAGALANCTNIVVANQHVITKVFFPRLVLPLAAVCSGLLDFAIGLVVMIALALSFGIHVTASVALLPVLLLLALLTALGVGLWTSALNALYRDVASIIPFLIQFWMLASPVAYPSSLVPARWRWLYGLNPMAGVIDGFRWALTGHGHPPGAQMLASTAMVAVVLVGGLFFFQRIESTVADRV
jgi:lipopolysaccharide transport system permease protein